MAYVHLVNLIFDLCFIFKLYTSFKTTYEVSFSQGNIVQIVVLLANFVLRYYCLTVLGVSPSWFRH